MADLRDDPRADPRMVAAMAAFGLDRGQPQPDVSPSSSREQLLSYVADAEVGFCAVFDALASGLEPVTGVSRDAVTIYGPDGNQIPLQIHRPAWHVGASLPCVVHLHGGGGVILSADDSCYVRWRDELAAHGTVVVGVEFRNAGGKLGSHPYPAGLNDCVAATEWVLARQSDLDIGNVVVSGESGGGNLALGVALKANREQWGRRPHGVYAMAPMIASPWEKPAALPSRRENDGYFISCALLAIMGTVYDPLGAHGTDAFCWPYHAADIDLHGLPPHVISVNELDPLRDEGLAYCRRLLANGVSAVGRTVAGTVHAAEVFFRAAMPDVYAATVRDIVGFARQL
ncbi:alpha/beta hydrolase fold domain-containing protein [Mycobacterium sp. URHB0044]|uniref:alpha/beta hydrolase fold domain-containing protein n=1 Tax=Mycobacterium sp. URHB0044 TaxID=1380386 RepID=UPI000491BE37|nr:alpha/beta hydrolase fold domain-containing protein [Mycobacterium sp. URHB0044]